MNSSYNKKPANKSLIIAVIAVIVVLLGFILFIIGKDNGTFSRNTFINEVEVSGLTAMEAEEFYNAQIEDLEFKFKKSNSEIVVLGSSFDYTEQLSEPLQPYLDSQTFTTRVSSLFGKKSHNISTQVSFSDNKLKKATNSICQDLNLAADPAKNAFIKKEDGDFTIIDEVPGNELLPEYTYEKLFLAVNSSQSDVDLNDANLFAKPEITADYLSENILVKFEKAAELKIFLDFGFVKEQVPQDLIYESVDLDTTTNELTVDTSVLSPFVAGLARKYDTLGQNRVFNTSNDAEITIGGGIYGWQMSVKNTLATLSNHIIALESGTYNPEYITHGFTRLEGNKDISDTYIEIDLTKQHMWFYKEGELIVSTDVVTGLPGTPRETPTGVYCIWSKETKRYLTGEEYKLWVEFWLPINWTGVGIHDAPWQTAFGGDHYLIYGSHGCINTPPEHAGTIYRNVEENTPVLVYKS